MKKISGIKIFVLALLILSLCACQKKKEESNPSIADYPIAYALTWRNAHDQAKHFYAPWEGFEGAADFKAFSELEDIKFLD